MHYLGKGEVLTNTDLDRFVNNIWERPFVYIEKVLDLWVQLMKNGGKNKSVVFIILFSVCIYIYNIYIFLSLHFLEHKTKDFIKYYIIFPINLFL